MTRPAAPPFVHQVPVRWGDMDTMGHVNNTLYFRYCEAARVAYFEQICGVWTSPDGAQGILLAAANLNFRRSLRYPNTAVVEVRTTALSNRSLTMDYAIRSQNDGTVAAEGSSVVVWSDYAQAKSAPWPEALARTILDFEGLAIDRRTDPAS